MGDFAKPLCLSEKIEVGTTIISKYTTISINTQLLIMKQAI